YADSSDELNLTRPMITEGFSDEDIQKIWGGNWLRVLNK
ncbi:MAG: membrane dipeptidase, partial [Bacteroidaceae bacterium]|nr:membrane dipeptidase [Bacteroidaceae bacterium]